MFYIKKFIFENFIVKNISIKRVTLGILLPNGTLLLSKIYLIITLSNKLILAF